MREIFYALVVASGRVLDQSGKDIGKPDEFRIVDAYTGLPPEDDKGEVIPFVEINTLGGWGYSIDLRASHEVGKEVLTKIHGEWKIYHLTGV